MQWYFITEPFPDQLPLVEAELHVLLLTSLQGNEPSVIQMRHMATHDFASVIARQIPLLPRLEIMPGDLDQEVGIKEHIYYTDVMMGAMASQITRLLIVYSTVYSGADQR